MFVGMFRVFVSCIHVAALVTYATSLRLYDFVIKLIEHALLTCIVPDQVLWALAEDELDGALLTPRLRRLRFRGGAQEMSTGFNTEHLDSEFSTVSVR